MLANNNNQVLYNIKIHFKVSNHVDVVSEQHALARKHLFYFLCVERTLSTSYWGGATSTWGPLAARVPWQGTTHHLQGSIQPLFSTSTFDTLHFCVSDWYSWLLSILAINIRGDGAISKFEFSRIVEMGSKSNELIASLTL